ncbi:WGR domain-containing protein [Allochromatium humboldtianum]|uniref:WGR domain-containing protein n=1 Tax=Allochromatium humboldtianum TaxID=504901 RepID=A0A850RR73_9GAMM|nr:WGR domain-containing protein [Allochromatium humboldtianum]NVZ11403.1 WGR domain-containing protein [Allochromatium humboldtianum]
MQLRWIHPEKQRYYQVELLQDLLGDWTLVQRWGGIGSHLGGQRIVWVESPEAGLTRIKQIRDRRRQHGYHEHSPGEHP